MLDWYFHFQGKKNASFSIIFTIFSFISHLFCFILCRSCPSSIYKDSPFLATNAKHVLLGTKKTHSKIFTCILNLNCFTKPFLFNILKKHFHMHMEILGWTLSLYLFTNFVSLILYVDPFKRGSTKHQEGSNLSRCKPFFRVEMCNLIFMVLVYVIYVILYICNSK